MQLRLNKVADDTFLVLPNKLTKKLGWKVGDDISMQVVEVNGEKKLLLQKVNNEQESQLRK